MTRQGRTLIPVTNRVFTAPEPPTGDEAELVRKAQGGDRPSFATLVDRYWDRLYRWLCRLTRNGTVAEDLTQETFLKAFAGLKSFQAGSNFRAWLFRIAHNNFVNQRRANRHARVPLAPEIAEEPRGPVGETLSREALRLVAEAVSKLPSDFRGALLLRVEEDLSFREIAEILAITEETARWRVFKARQKLMALLAPELLPAAPNDVK
jgi:RNA polymerase sigma-70 factor (ECF subfamily)